MDFKGTYFKLLPKDILEYIFSNFFLKKCCYCNKKFFNTYINTIMKEDITSFDNGNILTYYNSCVECYLKNKNAV